MTALEQDVPRGEAPSQDDDRQARWGRTQFDGFPVGRFLAAPPFFFTADHHPLWLTDLYRGRSLFLICSGPSFAKLPHKRLRQPGIMTMGVNNSARTFRPNLWVEVDSPWNFLRSIWRDPLIAKFAPLDAIHKPLFDSNTWKLSGETVADCPNVSYYKRNERFNAKQFLTEDSMNWGNHSSWGGGRTVMLPAVRIAYLLGFRRLFLLGVDMDMRPDKKYHFEQDRHAGSIKGNRATYGMLQERFAELRPLFEAEGFNVYNCNKDSELKAFEFVEFADAVRDVVNNEFGIDTAHERTYGLYERGGLQKKVDERRREADKLTRKAEALSTTHWSDKAKRKHCLSLVHQAVRQHKLATEAQSELTKLAEWKGTTNGDAK